MKHYFIRIPAASLHEAIDGHVYAYVDKTIGPYGATSCKPRMVRADACRVDNGVAFVFIGRMGDAIAQTNNLPFDVFVE